MRGILECVGDTSTELVLDPQAVAQALSMASASPFPRVTFRLPDESVVRIEGPPGGQVVEQRNFRGLDVLWTRFHRPRPPGVRPKRVPAFGRADLLRPETALLTSDEARDALTCALLAETPFTVTPEPWAGDDADPWVLAAHQAADPRPLGDLPQLEAFLTQLGPTAQFALAVPDRTLLVALRRSVDDFEVRWQRSRGTSLEDRSVVIEGQPKLPFNALSALLLSIARFDELPPGMSAR